MPNQDLTGTGVCWLGNMRYTNPLNRTSAKKWQALSQLGLRMYVIGFATQPRFQLFTQSTRFYLLPELPLALLRYLEFFLLTPPLLLWLVLRRHISVIIAVSPFDGAVAALVKNIAGILGQQVALVVESHGDFEVAVFQQRQIRLAGLYRRLMAALTRYALRHADVLRTVSNSSRQQLTAWSPKNQPMHQFMAWTDFSAFADLEREKSLLETQAIVYAGTLIPRKGIHTLLDAFARLQAECPGAEVWLIGKAENPDYTRQLQAQVERLQLTERVRFVGEVSHETLAAYMGRARVMVLASKSEGLPRVVIEGMASGLVVIASNVSGIPEVIEDGVNGYLIPPEDVDTLTAVLRQVLLDPHIDVIGERARAFARQFFSEAAFVEGHRRLLADALKTRLRQRIHA